MPPRNNGTDWEWAVFDEFFRSSHGDTETVADNSKDPIDPLDRTKIYSCYHCGMNYPITQREINTLYKEDRDLCPNCRKREMVLPYHRLTPHKQFYFLPEEIDDEKLFLGIEMEVDEGGESSRTVKNILPIMNESPEEFFIYCSHDGSLHNGIEIITQPATLKYHKSVMPKYKQMFKELIHCDYLSHDTSTCGLHIHINRDYFGLNESTCVAKILYLFEKFWDEIVIFSRRNKKRLGYSRKIDTSIQDYIRQWDKSCEHDGHYYAVNLVNEETIEFRVFRGTLNPDTFEAILDFISNCATIVKKLSNAEIQKLNFEDLLSDKGKEFYGKRKLALSYED